MNIFNRLTRFFRTIGDPEKARRRTLERQGTLGRNTAPGARYVASLTPEEIEARRIRAENRAWNATRRRGEHRPTNIKKIRHRLKSA